MTINELKDLFIRKCTNLYRASTVIQGKKQAMIYMRTDLTKWAAEAFARGEDVFYANYIDPTNPNSEMYLAPPNYEYSLIRNLTEEEYESVFNVDE